MKQVLPCIGAGFYAFAADCHIAAKPLLRAFQRRFSAFCGVEELVTGQLGVPSFARYRACWASLFAGHAASATGFTDWLRGVKRGICQNR